MMIESIFHLDGISVGKIDSINSTAVVIKEAPVLVLIFREKANMDNLSIGACVENMCLRATDLGVGSLWSGDAFLVANDVAKMLGYENMELNCALLLGYADQFPNMRSRKELNDIMEQYDGGRQANIRFYKQTSLHTDSGLYKDFARNLTDDIDELCILQRMQIIHLVTFSNVYVCIFNGEYSKFSFYANELVSLVKVNAFPTFKLLQVGKGCIAATVIKIRDNENIQMNTEISI